MKKIMFFIVLLVFSGFVYADACIAGSGSCGNGNWEECISAEIMDEMEESEAALEEAAAFVPSVGAQAGVRSFNVTLNGSDGYKVYSLTNYRDEQRRMHDLVSSIKNQISFGDCTRFAAMGALEIKLAKQYADILQTAKDEVIRNGGDSGIVEANLSEAYAKEIAGCRNNTIKVMERIAKRDAVQEEHSPFHDRFFGEPEYYSKRNIQRYEDFVNINKDCDKEKSWNKKLQDKAKQQGWLRIQPGKPKKISGIEKVKNHIINGEPVVMSYRYSCSEKQAEQPINAIMVGAGAHMGKFDKALYLHNKKNDKKTGHAVIVVGYMEADDANNPDYFIIKNSHYDDNTLELFPLDDDFKKYCKPKYHIFGDVKVFLGERELDERLLATIDYDNDGIPDIFDNSAYSLDYFSDLPNASFNPAQNEVDNDGSPLEKDFCPYIEDNIDRNVSGTAINLKADMDMNGVGDFCDLDIDGDGINNIDEGLSTRYLYRLLNSGQMLSEKEYAALNPFIDGRTGKISGNYFLSPAYMISQPLVVNQNYIQDNYFYHPHLKNDYTNQTGSFKFVNDSDMFKSWWYSGFSAQGKWMREFHYIDENGKEQILYGLKWNIPGLFEMKDIPYSQYKEENYGENYPENFFNCLLHCENLTYLYSWKQQNLTTLDNCRMACRNAYQCTIGHGIDRDCDGIRNDYDNCPDTYNPEQSDTDSDGDGVPDTCDNCLNIPNPKQEDADKDGVGDACDKCPNDFNPFQEDSDSDGTPDACDNCPDIKNPKQEDWDKDGIGDICDKCPNHPDVFKTYRLNSEFISGASGAIAQKAGELIIKPLIQNHKIILDYSYKMLPDSDLDGTPDSCDFGSTGDGFASSKIKSAYNFLSISKSGIIENKSSLTVKLSMHENSGRGLNFCESNIFQIGTTCNAAVHYCAITKQQNDDGWWGRPGFCSTSDKAGGSISGVNFGYSHGSDDFSPRSIESWKSRISVADSAEEARGEKWGDPNKFVNSNDPNDDPIRKLVKVNSFSGGATIWNWRRDWYEKSDCLGANQGSDLCKNLLNGGDSDEDNTMYAAISTSIVPIKGSNLRPEDIPEYYFPSMSLPGLTIPARINQDYFPPTNTNKFARASRYKIEPIELNYWTAKLSMPNPNTDIIFQKPVELPNIELCASCYFDMPIRYFGINEIQPYEYVSRYEIRKDSENKVLLDSQRIMFQKDQIAFGEISPKEMIGIESNGKEYFLTINTSESGADWNRIGRIENWDSEITGIESWSANYFIAKNSQGVKNLYSIELVSEIPQNLEEILDSGELPEMIYTVNNLGETGFDREQTKLVFANGMLYLFANSGNGFGTYLHNGKIFEEIQGLMPQQRKIVNVSVSGRYLFLAGGTDSNNETMNDLWRFDTETNTWEQIPVELQGSFSKVIMQEVNGRMVAFNPVIDENTTFPVFEFENSENVDNIEVLYSRVKIEDLDFEQTFCISETDDSIFPGITNFYGECVKVQNYDFNEVTFPDYKFSVAGYRNSLYLGGLSGIRRVEIGENGEITKKEIVYSGETNNLAIFGNTLYAANYNEIDIFEIADDGVIQRKSSIKTNDCKNIRIDGNKLFAAENKRIRVFDLANPLSPELIQTISLGNKAEDLEIAENRLFVYENQNGLLTRNGKVTVFDVSDAANPDKINEFSQYCNDPEMQKSGNNVYLGCKNGTFKVTESGLQSINGSKNYLREGYVFDGILYQVFSGTLHKSSLKAEEIEEGGWF